MGRSLVLELGKHRHRRTMVTMSQGFLQRRLCYVVVILLLLTSMPGTHTSTCATAKETTTDTTGRDEKKEEDEFDRLRRRLYFADRHVQKMLQTWQDPECMSKSLDARSFRDETKLATEAVRIYKKCRIVHIQNFVNLTTLQTYKYKVSNFLTGIASGRISDKGRTSIHGEYYYIQEVSAKRFDVRFPQELVIDQDEIFGSNQLLRILSDATILGEDLQLLDAGAMVAEPGAPFQPWHTNGEFLFPDSLKTSGLGGHEIPSYGVNAIIPLSIHKHNETTNPALHGPMEFCIGSSHVVGFETEPNVHEIPFENETLRDILYIEYWEHYGAMCPPKAWRQPLVEFGDILLFDYTLESRGGFNQHSDMANTMLYNTYARSWYKDPNFQSENEPFESEQRVNPLAKASPKMKNLLRNLRFAIPDDLVVTTATSTTTTRNTTRDFYAHDYSAFLTSSSLETLTHFRPSYTDGLYKDNRRYGYMFILSNVDVAMDLQICDERGTCWPVPLPGNNMVVKETALRTLKIVDKNYRVLTSFVVGTHGHQMQVLLEMKQLFPTWKRTATANQQQQ